MKKKKADIKDKKTGSANNTSHQRALASPEVQTTLNSLRENWAELTRERRGEQLARLIDAGCSVRGIAKEINQPARTLGRYVPPVENPEADGDWEGLLSTISETEDSDSDAPESSIDAAGDSLLSSKGTQTLPTSIPRLKSEEADAHHQPSSPPLAKAPVRVKGRVSLGENRTEEVQPKVDLVAAFRSNIERRRDHLQRLAEPYESRPIRNPRSLPRQGETVPPKNSR